jgi:2-polyprenyl-3-methyl-5-hydroxy-6-metoxy-1,4-benzoquinol methylase
MISFSSTNEFAAWNELMVARYDIDRFYTESHLLVKWIEARRLELLLELAAASDSDRILEVGCGAGHVLERFRGFERTGVDLSPTMLHRARSRLGARVSLIRASAEELPFADATFDVVICTEVLEHTQNPRNVIKEIMRVAARGARVVVSVPNERNIDRAKRLLRRLPLGGKVLRRLAAEGNEWHVHRFDAAHLSLVVSGVATIAQIRGVPYRWMPARYVAALQPMPERDAHTNEGGVVMLRSGAARI